MSLENALWRPVSVETRVAGMDNTKRRIVGVERHLLTGKYRIASVTAELTEGELYR